MMVCRNQLIHAKKWNQLKILCMNFRPHALYIVKCKYSGSQGIHKLRKVDFCQAMIVKDDWWDPLKATSRMYGNWLREPSRQTHWTHCSCTWGQGKVWINTNRDLTPLTKGAKLNDHLIPLWLLNKRLKAGLSK